MSKRLIVTMSERHYGLVVRLAKDWGLPAPEYVRHLITKALEDNSIVPTADSKAWS